MKNDEIMIFFREIERRHEKSDESIILWNQFHCLFVSINGASNSQKNFVLNLIFPKC